MNNRIRGIVGGLSILLGGAVWALSLMIWQPADERSTSWPGWAGWSCQCAGSDDYWIRDVRQGAILLAVGGLILLTRGVRFGAVCVAAVGWLGLDLLFDRINVGGTTLAVIAGLCAALMMFALAYGLGRGGGATSRPVLFVGAVVVGGLALTATSGWQSDGPLTGIAPDGVPPGYQGGPRIVGQTAVAVAFDIALVALAFTLALTAARTISPARSLMASVLAVISGSWLLITEFVELGGNYLAWALRLTFAAVVVLGVAAVSLDRPGNRRGWLVYVLVAPVGFAFGTLALFGLFFLGSFIGAPLTSVIGNPPVMESDNAMPILVMLVGVASGQLIMLVRNKLDRSLIPVAARGGDGGEPLAIPS